MKAIRLGSRALDVLAEVICGGTVPGADAPISPYRKQTALCAFFREDIGVQLLSPTSGASRTQWTRYELGRVNGTETMRLLLSAVGRPVDFYGTMFSVDVVAEVLNGFLAHEGIRLVPGKTGLAVLPLSAAQVEAPKLTNAYVHSLAEKCEERLGTGDFEGAISAARTLLEAVLAELEETLLGERKDHKGDLPRQFRGVAKALKMDDQRPELDERFRELVRGLTSIVNSVGALRNGMSDAHPRKRAPAEHHARLIVNSSKTAAMFLVDSYNWQRARARSAAKEESK